MSRDRVKTKVDRSGEVDSGFLLEILNCFLVGQGLQPDSNLEQPGRGGVLQDLDGRPLRGHCWHSWPLHSLRIRLLWHFCCHSLAACTLEGLISIPQLVWVTIVSPIGWWLLEEILWFKTSSAHQRVLWADVHLPPLLDLPLWHGPCLLANPPSVITPCVRRSLR